jgi:hypothetical protein
VNFGFWNWEIGKFLLLRQNDSALLWPSKGDFPISQFQNFPIPFETDFKKNINPHALHSCRFSAFL